MSIRSNLRSMAAAFSRSLAAITSEKRCGICAAPIGREEFAIGGSEATEAAAAGYLAPDRPNVPKTDATGNIENGGVSPFRLGICRRCLADLPRHSGSSCLRCGEFVSEFVAAQSEAAPEQDETPQEPCAGICGHCLTEPPPWQKIYFHGAYQGLLRESIIRLKFGQTLHLAEALGDLLAAHPELVVLRSANPGGCRINNSVPGAEKPDRPYSCIIPIPLHKNRLAERGFNQSTLLAAPLAKALGVRLELDLLKRPRDTTHQTGLSRELRHRNMLEAFAAQKQAKGLNILLFDDVLTTGATLASAAACLLRVGAARVDVAVLARTPQT